MANCTKESLERLCNLSFTIGKILGKEAVSYLGQNIKAQIEEDGMFGIEPKTFISGYMDHIREHFKSDFVFLKSYIDFLEDSIKNETKDEAYSYEVFKVNKVLEVTKELYHELPQRWTFKVDVESMTPEQAESYMNTMKDFHRDHKVTTGLTPVEQPSQK